MEQGKAIYLPASDEALRALRAGDNVRITGSLYTARDAAHRRLIAALDAGEELPVS
jgi:fumarate hydratase subunit beta